MTPARRRSRRRLRQPRRRKRTIEKGGWLHDGRAGDRLRADPDSDRDGDSGLPIDVDTEGYPKELSILVEGVDQVGQLKKRLKFLRRAPVDPMTGKAEWGLRSLQDAFDSTSWGGQNVYDVY